MKRKKKKEEGQTLRLVFVFFVLVGLLLVGSVLVKLATVIEKSRFDGAHRFTVEFTSKDKPFTKVVSFAPDTRSISIITVQNAAAIPQISKFLGIPIDTRVRLNNRYNEDIPQQLKTMLFYFNNFETDLTFIDLFRLWFFAKGVPSSSFTLREISSSLDEAAIDRTSSSLFLDYTLSRENISIQVINGTGVLGLGNRLARLITNTGGNVVSVETAESLVEKSELSFHTEKTYTLEKLKKILGFQTRKLEEKGIADIIITIGQDNGELTFF
ncbi:LytR C-terminal domain-containing protein [Candidatus Daviesbacteria bacterium]|nr:LytR C-terminal domain-containing protein [Candidatus Daviesbacteria bacterium]